MNLLIIGAGGHGRVVYDIARMNGSYDRIAFLDDNMINDSTYEVIGRPSDILNYKDEFNYAFVAVGNAKIRSKILDEIKNDFNIVTIIHPSASIAQSSCIDYGVYVGANAVINSNCRVEEGCIVGIGALIDHDCIISKYSYVNAGAIVRVNSHLNEYSLVSVGEIYPTR